MVEVASGGMANGPVAVAVAKGTVVEAVNEMLAWAGGRVPPQAIEATVSHVSRSTLSRERIGIYPLMCLTEHHAILFEGHWGCSQPNLAALEINRTGLIHEPVAQTSRQLIEDE